MIGFTNGLKESVAKSNLLFNTYVTQPFKRYIRTPGEIKRYGENYRFTTRSFTFSEGMMLSKPKIATYYKTDYP